MQSPLHHASLSMVGTCGVHQGGKTALQGIEFGLSGQRVQLTREYVDGKTGQLSVHSYGRMLGRHVSMHALEVEQN